MPPCGTAGAIPPTAQGVRARAEQTFDTFLMSVVGIGSSPPRRTPPPSSVRSPARASACLSRSRRRWSCATSPGTSTPFATGTRLITTAPASTTERGRRTRSSQRGHAGPSNIAIIPLCTTGPGSVGWLDFGCGNLADQILDPCDIFVNIPGWVETNSGNINCCEGELSTYHGDEPGVFEEDGVDDDDNVDVPVKLPIHTTTCEEAPTPADRLRRRRSTADAVPGGEWTGEGDNLDYGVPFWVAFVLDEAFVQGIDNECEEAPGSPQLVDPSGLTGCGTVLSFWTNLRMTCASIGFESRRAKNWKQARSSSMSRWLSAFSAVRPSTTTFQIVYVGLSRPSSIGSALEGRPAAPSWAQPTL